MHKLRSHEVHIIKPHRIIRQIISVLTFAGMWERDSNQFVLIKWLKKILHLLLATSLCTAVAAGSYLSAGNNEALFLLAAAIGYGVHVVKLFYILTQKQQILSFLDDVCVHSISDVKKFTKVQQKLNSFAKFGYVNVYFMAFGMVCFVIASLPIFSSEVSLPLNIGFPLDWKHSRINYWMAYSLITVGTMAAITVTFFTVIYWYILLNCSIKYQILGHELRTMGERTASIVGRNKNSSSMDKQKLLSQYYVRLIETHQNIQTMVSNVKSCFSHLFLVQVTTSNICICCAVCSLAFSSTEDRVKLVMNCLIFCFNTFDLFAVLYLGNEITAASADLMYCVFESDWVGQSKTVTMDVIILTEKLKKPQELVLLKLYPMNLVTFTSISKLTYSMFNLLKTFA